MSHPLPPHVLTQVTRLVVGIEEALQADIHNVWKVKVLHPGFKTGWLESALVRALVSSAAQDLTGEDYRIEDMGNGGVELVIVHEGVERRFRIKRARLDCRGQMEVTANSDSLLTKVVAPPSLFDDETSWNAPLPTQEQWAIACLFDSRTLTFSLVKAGRVVGKRGNKPPFRLNLADLVVIPHAAPMPSDFRPDQEDLDLGEHEDRGEETG